MVYLCLIGEEDTELESYLELNGYIENRPLTTDIESEYRAKYVDIQRYKLLEANEEVVICLKLIGDYLYSLLYPIGAQQYYTYCDGTIQEYIKRQFKNEVVTVLIEGDNRNYVNQLSEYSNDEYKELADVVISKSDDIKNKISKIGNYVGRINNENLSKMYDNNKK